MTAVVTRFAPSPTGLLHLGNARTALFAWLYARAGGGRFLLRIEDTDAARSRGGWRDALLEDLDWLGLRWDGEPWHQSGRGGIYNESLARLVDAGQAYPCFCTAEELEAAHKRQQAAHRPPRYPGTCAKLPPDESARRVAAGEPHTLRFRIPPGRGVDFDDLVFDRKSFKRSDLEDFIIRREDGTPVFLFANAIDDALAGVTVVLRGEDHLSNTPKQLLLLEALGLPAPAYGHLPLLRAPSGEPMSKRGADDGPGRLATRASPFSVRHFRETGHHPLALVNYLARLGLSWPHEDCLPLAGLADSFDASHFGRAPARFDDAQLAHWQRVALDTLTADAWWAWAGSEAAAAVPDAQRGAFAAAVRPNVLYPGDAVSWALACFSDTLAYNRDAMERIAATPASFFEAARVALATHGGDADAVAAALSEATGLRGKALYAPLRAALTGRLDGPGFGDLLGLIGTARADARLDKAMHEGSKG